MRRTSRHYVVGVAGLGIMRTWLTAARETLDERMRQVVGMASATDEPALAIELDVPELGVVEGYARWAANYDAIPNPLIRLEEPVVRRLIDDRPPGLALDAACGTGRHTRQLVARGHRVIGVDASPDMLARARRALPEVDFRPGDLTALPVESASVDLALCTLALSHCERLEPSLVELGRVLRPGGRLILSDLHPMQLELGVTAFFIGEDGRAAQVRSFRHLHEEYLAGFAAAGLVPLRSFEPRAEEEDVMAMSGGLMHLAEDAFRDAFLGLPAALVWELERRGRA